MDAGPDDPRLGTILDGRYRLNERLAQGSMGVVYRAERVQLGRDVAIKFLHGLYAAQPQFVQRFEREVRVMSRMAHPHCVSIVDVGMADAPYVVMEYVTGRTLRTVLDDGRLPIERAIQIARQILAGLAHAHALGIVHRDIKPANVMLTEATGTGDHVRILDFGLATLVGSAPGDVSQSQVVVGTPSYMAPEQSLGDKVDGRADLYAVGVVLFELLTGMKPFRADSAIDLIRMHREATPPRLADVAPEVGFSPLLEQALAKALVKRPADRFASALEMSRALGEATRTGSSPSIATADTVAMEAAAPAPRGRSWGWAAAVLVLAGGAALAWRGGVLERLPWVADGEAPRQAVVAPSREPAPDDDAAPVLAAPPLAASPALDAATGLADVPPGAVTVAGATLPALDAEPLDVSDDDAADPDRDAGPEPGLPAAEEREPVAPLPDSVAAADTAEPTSVAEAEARPAPARPTERADTLEEALALIASGKRDAAIAALHRVGLDMKRSAYVPYLLGNLYFEKRWWTVAMEHYRQAIAKNRVYRKKLVLNRNVIRALGDRRTQAAASGLIQRAIGRAALPHLDRAAKLDPNRNVRRRAAVVARVLRRRR